MLVPSYIAVRKDTITCLEKEQIKSDKDTQALQIFIERMKSIFDEEFRHSRPMEW